MKIAVIGSGGREHAILCKLARDGDGQDLIALPGNAGTTGIARNVAVDVANVEMLAETTRSLKPDLVIVGPEVPLAMGIADRLKQSEIRVFGPSASAARIESSKVFAKTLMREYGIPTAEFSVHDRMDDVVRALGSEKDERGFVVKADGLAAGKGVYVCDTRDEALAAARALLVERTLGDAGAKIILEARLSGREMSCMYWCCGENYAALPAAQDYKRARDGDRGPNTGGMGALCPTPVWNDALGLEVERAVIAPILQALAKSGIPFYGLLYAGLMLTERGPMVIEFNCRFGDPETQVILPVWDGNFAEYALACAEGTLETASMRAPSKHAVCVVLAANEYPGEYVKQIPLSHIHGEENGYAIHAGTALKDGQIVSTGGRVLNAIGVGATLEDARTRAYQIAEKLCVPGLRYRNDIGIL